MTEKLDMSSPDLVSQNIEKIAVLFPNCVTETHNGIAIDFDLLKQELQHDVVDGTIERYRLEWPGKREAIVTANLPTTKTLRPVREDSVDFDNTENIYIEGDNLEVLKLLQESYLGKIKMIYIDPPYNTGKDFVYKDNFTQDTDEYQEEAGLKDEYHNRLVANPDTSGRYHSDWLTMMYPRLKLARNLLTDDGVIFISIDDNEQANLKRICDEIFGEDNFISNVVWEKMYTTKNDSSQLSECHEYIITYAKNIFEQSIRLLPRTAEMDARYTNPDNDSRGIWKSIPLYAKGERKNGRYPVISPTTGKIHLPNNDSHWLYAENDTIKLIEENRIYFGKDGNAQPNIKRFLTEVQQGAKSKTLWKHTEVGSNDSAKREMKNLYEDGNIPFDFPKPLTLLNRMLLLTTQKKDIVLDFFSGSATTAHSVMQLNTQDSGNRKFIMVQVPARTDEKSEAFKAGYENICEIGKERIRRAGNKLQEELKSKLAKKDGELDLENEIKDNYTLDTGFRVYRLDESNMREVYYRPQDFQQGQLDVFADNVKPDRTADDLLAQVMLDWGLPLSLKIEQIEVDKKQVFKVAENSLMACFDNDIDETFAKEVANHKPLRIVFKDSSFKDDTAKENVKQLLKQLSPETEMKVI